MDVPPPELHRQDVLETVAGLSGYYSGTDLYARYRTRCEVNGRQPGTHQRFYRELGRLGYCKHVVFNISCYVIDSSAERHPGSIDPVRAMTETMAAARERRRTTAPRRKVPKPETKRRFRVPYSD